MNEEVIPCKDCIAFALCNAKVKHLEGVYKTRFILMRIENHCTLLSDWLWVLREEQYNAYKERDSERISAFCKFYQIKYDQHPDYHLLRHLERNDEYENPLS